MQENHLLTSDEKLKYWGYGEWVEEPDEVYFIHDGIECRIHRMFAKECSAHLFGGHLCGYISIPNDNSCYEKHYDDIEIEVHGGLTYAELENDGKYWVGFDCAHSMDYVPSTEYLYKTDPQMIKIKKRNQELKEHLGLHGSPIFNNSYKNIQFCINECKSMAEQLNALTNK